MSQPPVAPAQYAYLPPAAPPPPKKKKRGCCSCCLWFVLIIVILSVSFVVAAQFIMRSPSNPVKEEYESIPDYFSRLIPENQENQSGTQELRNEVSNPQSAIRNPQSAITIWNLRTQAMGIEPEIRVPKSDVRRFQFAIRNPQFAIDAIRTSQLSGGAHV